MLRTRLNCALAFSLLVICVLGCKPGGASTSTNANPPVPTTETASNTVNLEDIAGSYNVVGTNPNGSPYKGTLEVIKHGDVFQFRWTAGSQYDGVGIANGRVIAVAFADGPNGKGCGVVDYQIAADGALNGRWGYWGVDEAGTEMAKRTGGSGLAGQYDTSGANPDGKQYKGTMSVASQGGGYRFSWSNGADGFGIKQGDNIAVGIGGQRCAFVSYQIKPGGVLDGIWGGYGTSQTGTEIATKR